MKAETQRGLLIQPFFIKKSIFRKTLALQVTHSGLPFFFVPHSQQQRLHEHFQRTLQRLVQALLLQVQHFIVLLLNCFTQLEG